jgi:hypothetical protein
MPIARLLLSLAKVSRVNSRIAPVGNRAPGDCQALDNITATRYIALAKLMCVSITHAHNTIRQWSASCGNISAGETAEQAGSGQRHTAALRLKFSATSRCTPPFFRLSNIEMDGRN